MLFQTGSQENGERSFGGRRIFSKSSNLAAVWWREEHLVFLALWSRTAWSLQGRTLGTSHILGLQCQGCSQNLLDCGTEHLAVSREQPIASLHGWIFTSIFFCHSLHLGFTFPTTLYSSFSLCLVIWNCCSRGTMFTMEESQELVFVHPWMHFTDGLLLFQYKWVFYSLLPCLEPQTKSNLGHATKK